MRVFFSAGEASGDAYAAELMSVLMPERIGFLRQRLADFRNNFSQDTSDEQLVRLMLDNQLFDESDIVHIVAAFEQDTGQRVPEELLGGGHGKLLDFISRSVVASSNKADIFFEAVGGRRCETAGAHIVADSSNWGALGILEALKVYPRVLVGFNRAKRALRSRSPGVFIPIDFGYMNIRLARYAKRFGWKVLYFIPPGSWRKDKQGGDLPAVTDAIITPFPWSAELLNKMGANAHYFGHPLKEMVARVPDVADRKGIAVLPGSRRHEIDSNIPAIAEAIKEMQGPVHIGVAPTANKRVLLETWLRWSDHEPILHDRSVAAFKSARSAIVCSGTATLEAALCACPCVVVYRGTKLMEIEYKIRKPSFEYISLPNILLGRPLLKELIQWDANPANIKVELEQIHNAGPSRTEILQAFQEISDSLGMTDCLEKTAALAKTLASRWGPWNQELKGRKDG